MPLQVFLTTEPTGADGADKGLGWVIGEGLLSSTAGNRLLLGERGSWFRSRRDRSIFGGGMSIFGGGLLCRRSLLGLGAVSEGLTLRNGAHDRGVACLV